MKQVDVAIIGCGPAGLSAAINVKARNRALLLIGPKLCSPSLHKAHKINNYLGLDNYSGEAMRQQFLKHVRDDGIEITQVSVAGIYPMGDIFQLQIRDSFVEAKAVIITTGVSGGKQLPGEDEFIGKGVSYCGTCDAMFYQDKIIAVSSDGTEYEDEVEFLAEVVEKIYYLPNYEVTATLPANVEIIKSKIQKFTGSARLEVVELENGQELQVDGAFLLKEQLPLAQLITGLELADKHIKVDENMSTNIAGVFAAGDVAGRPHQVAKAVGQGQVAALSAASYIDAHK
ncbi:MAG: NAD(P)/FAD-dependent oxidoreductase [Firmicutes bacterium]|nr:NAD(P)/FAD-dependent oxidoreductase [Bacillota bacterium]